MIGVQRKFWASTILRIDDVISASKPKDMPKPRGGPGGGSGGDMGGDMDI
jgi:hypothetical protein